MCVCFLGVFFCMARCSCMLRMHVMSVCMYVFCMFLYVHYVLHLCLLCIYAMHVVHVICCVCMLSTVCMYVRMNSMYAL